MNIKCMICGKEFKWLPSHLRVHNINVEEYQNRFPDAKIMSDEVRLLHSGENNAMFGKVAWNKGLTKKTDKRVLKYSISSKGHKRPDLKEKQTGKTFEEIWGVEKATEMKKKISIKNTGKVSWKKGLTKKTNESIRIGGEKLKGRPKTKEHRKKLCGKRGPNEKLKGRIISEEHRKKISKANNKNAKVKVNCKYCNKEFYAYRSEIKNGGGMFCSIKCKGKQQTKLNKANRIKTNCSYCGKEIILVPSQIKTSTNHFCSYKCHGKWKSEHMIKEKTHLWRGGISFEPYCVKFNKEFKERVRYFFGKCCYICGKNEIENKKKLDVHHVNYQKMACCSEEIPPLFVPLCTSCHGKTHGNRDFWEEFFSVSLEYLTDSKSFYTKDEIKEITFNNNLGCGSFACF